MSREGSGQIRLARPSSKDLVQPPLKRRRTASSAKPAASHGSHVPAATGNATGTDVESPRQQSLANPIDHIFQFHKVSFACILSDQYAFKSCYLLLFSALSSVSAADLLRVEH